MGDRVPDAPLTEDEAELTDEEKARLVAEAATEAKRRDRAGVEERG